MLSDFIEAGREFQKTQGRRYWKREYRVVFPDLGLEYNNIDNKEGLNMSFDVQKDLTEETNKGKVKLWNLAPENRAKVEKKDTKVELYAGYRDYDGPVMVFKGTVIEAVTENAENDMTTELTLSDGQVEVRDSVFSLSFPPGTNGKVIVKAIAAQMGLTIVWGKDVSFKDYSDGYSFSGYGKDALGEVCSGSSNEWSIQNGILQIIKNGDVLTNRGIVFESDSGLLGSPKRIVKSRPKSDTENKKRTQKKKDKKEKPEKQAGWKIKTLLTPVILPGDAVEVRSSLINGWFRVEGAHHTGTLDGDWTTELDLIEGVVDNASGTDE